MSRTELPVVSRDRPSLDAAGLQAALASSVSGEVRFDRLSRALYSTDASVYQIVPLGVVLPKTRSDVLATIAACARFGVPLTGRGGGTSQAGQAIGPGIILDCSKYFNRVLEINPGERWVRVEPGCVLDDLNLQVKSLGLQFAPDISTSNRATIGGMVANNSSGTHSVIHGKTGDHVLEVTVALADGTVLHARPLSVSELEAKCRQQDLEGECYRTVRRQGREHAAEIERRYPKILRRVGGYNLEAFLPDREGFSLAQLLVGSEGTLAVTLEAKLRLIELPKAKALLVIQFADLLEALAATPAVLAHQPAAVEVIDRYVLESTRLNPEASRLRDFLAGDPGAILIVEFYAERAEELPARLQALEADLCQRAYGYHYHPATAAEAQQRIWKLRKAALGLSMAEKGDAKAISFVEDTAVAPPLLRDYIAEFLELIRRHGTTAGVYAHASVGCLHVRPVINLKTEGGIQQFEQIAKDVAGLVLKYGGALSGEHGDGLVRSPFQEKMYGPTLYAAFRELKRTFDPRGLFNPGKIVDAPSLATNLRYGAAYVTPDVATTFDFRVDGGIARSAELCAGVGECRKKREGSMCPSYRATGEEQHSTRGRANALRLAVTGQLGFRGFTDPAVAAALDLCLECKACKSECPTNVDMARLKAEFLHQSFQEHGVPWRNRVFGHVAELARWGCRLAPVSNLIVQNAISRWLNERLLRIDRRRRPPRFAARTFLPTARGLALDRVPPESSNGVLFFVDTFVNFYEPDLGIAALGALRRTGCSTVHVPPDLHCCGRPLISNGLLAKAVRHAHHNVERLHPWAEQGRPIFACEPSCLLTLKDDYPALLTGEARRRAEVVAKACLTFEEVLVSLAASRQPKPPDSCGVLGESGGLPPPPAKRRVLVQGHCHQRSLVGMGPTLRLLRQLPNMEIVELDAGCCGMAGSFGYECEHYEISRAVGEQALFPVLRREPADTIVVASGFSCRMQIEHFTGRKALHPAHFWKEVGFTTD
jgi:FAD/FMN-containing dehydrogenase/Fe-S oxidoreductase